MEKFIGQNIDDLKERELFIKDNADAVEDKPKKKRKKKYPSLEEFEFGV